MVSRSYHDFGISWSHNSLPGGEGLIAYKFTASVIDQTGETVATASFSGKARLDDVIDAFAEKLAEYAKEREGQERFRLRYQ